MPKYSLAAHLVALATIMSPCVFADDGGISFGGNPHLLKGHATVAMKSEVVKIDVGEKLIKVDCNFVFHNSGPACTVRVGFPDEGTGAAEPYQGEPLPKNPKASFITYDSWVDGKKVKTELVPTNDRSLYWHAKTVTFEANRDCVIRDQYTLPPGAQVTSDNGLYQQTSYVLHTGASWRGPIGRAEIVVSFAPNLISKPMVVKPLKSLQKNYAELGSSNLAAHTIAYEGPSQPKVELTTLRFIRTSFKPTKQDDVHLIYAYKKN